jgi:hypothetical protein
VLKENLAKREEQQELSRQGLRWFAPAQGVPFLGRVNPDPRNVWALEFPGSEPGMREAEEPVIRLPEWLLRRPPEEWALVINEERIAQHERPRPRLREGLRAMGGMTPEDWARRATVPLAGTLEDLRELLGRTREAGSRAPVEFLPGELERFR